MKKTLSFFLAFTMVFGLISCTQKKEVEIMEFLTTSQAVINLIDSIEIASLETVSMIDAAYSEYLSLSNTEKEEVSNYAKLEKLLSDTVKILNPVEREGDRIDHTKINIGTYCYYFNDDYHAKELADAGIDFVAAGSANTEYLEALHKYGIGVLVSAGAAGIPTWRVGDRPMDSVQPTPPFSMDDFRAALENVQDHEAIWGFDIVDEPYGLDFPFYNDCATAIREKFPHLITYINLYPDVGESRRLGSVDYQAHVNEFSELVDVDYSCFDQYMYRQSKELFKFLYSLKYHAAACDAKGRDLWSVIAVNSHIKDDQKIEDIPPLEVEQLQIQAYIAMAFGARVITWACWQPGWWVHNVYDSQGQRSAQYEKLQSVNETIHRISPIYMRYEYIDTCVLGRNVQDTYEFRRIDDNIIHQDVFKNIQLSNECSLIVNGYYQQPNSNNVAMMFTNVSDHLLKESYNPPKVSISFEIDDSNAVVTAYHMGFPYRIYPENGVYSFCFENAEYVFVTVDYPTTTTE